MNDIISNIIYGVPYSSLPTNFPSNALTAQQTAVINTSQVVVVVFLVVSLRMLYTIFSIPFSKR
jgi:hypothetical protein